MSASEPPEPIVVTKREWISTWSVLLVQCQNAFNDNFLKILLISLAGVVAKGTLLGDQAQYLMSALIPIPFVLFAPVAGFLSDRFPKSVVIFWCVVGQLGIFGVVLLSFYLHNPWLGIFAFFLLAAQSTAFSPAKQGILKELVGSKNLGMVNGLMQMLVMIGILGGIFLGGTWFGAIMKKTDGADPWRAAMIPTLVIAGIALIPLIVKVSIQRTPVYSHAKFTGDIWLRHFRHLRELLAEGQLRRTVLGISYYWLLASFLGALMVSFGKERFPDTETGQAATMTSMIGAMMGVGIMMGSVLTSVLSRKGINLNLVPVGGVGIAVSLTICGFVLPGSTAFYVGMVLLGVFSALFIVPLTSLLQDLVEEERRGRMISASVLLTSLAGVVALAFGSFLTYLKVSAGHQLLIFVIPTVIVTVLVIRFLQARERRLAGR